MIYPDSSLASEFVQSPNFRTGRLYPLTKITIHHAAMVCNAQTIAKVFVPRSRSASATYCVGNDGSIVQCVREADMPWTTSSSDNDNRAITIEVGNSARGGQWPVSDAALEATIKLCVDICQRNKGIGRINYTGDKTGNLTMHCWFANTQCPGPYLKSKFQYIADEVNRRIDAATTPKEDKKEEEVDFKPAMKTIYDINIEGLDANAAAQVKALAANAKSFTMTAREIEDATNYTKLTSAAKATAAQMITYIKKKNAAVPQSVINMIPYYLSEGATEGIAGDIAFAQSCVETGNFAFPQETCNVTIGQNNFAMMGVVAADSKGESFATPQLGIRAQIQHLKAYANTDALVGECVDPRFKYVTRGSAPYVEWLGQQENPAGKGWASSKNYGSKILAVLAEVRKTVAEVEKPIEKPEPVATLAVGDLVTIEKNAPVYGTNRAFSSWVYNKKLYVRAINGDRITVSIYRSGAITGNVDRKYLTKV